MTTPQASWQCPPRRVVVAVDFGEASAHAVAVAGLIASAYDACLVALHAERFDPPPYFTAGQLDALDEERRAAARARALDVTAFVARHTAYPVDPVVVDDDPSAALLAAASTADLLVLGTHNTRGPFRWWLGSVAERVALDSPVPVLVVGRLEGPPADVLQRIAVMHRGTTVDDQGRRCAGVLAGAAAGRVVDAGTVTSCAADVLASATCAVLTLDRHAEGNAAADVADLLSRCPHPLLIVPL